MGSLLTSVGFNDTYLTCGDSIVYHTLVDGGASPAFQPLMQTTYGHYPNVIINGIGGQRASMAEPLMDGYLRDGSHAAIVTMGWGLNDAAGGVSTSSYSADMQSIIQKILARKMIPVIPTVTYSTNYDTTPYNTVITGTLWGISGVRQGPDLYSLIFNNPSYLSGDGDHPTAAGYTAVVAAWAAAFSFAYS